MTNEVEGQEKPGPEAGKPTSGRKSPGGGGGAWAGISVALLMGARSLVPLMRSVGPGGRHVLLFLLAGAAPVMIGLEVRRRREERRREAERAERARARLARGGRPAGGA